MWGPRAVPEQLPPPTKFKKNTRHVRNIEGPLTHTRQEAARLVVRWQSQPFIKEQHFNVVINLKISSRLRLGSHQGRIKIGLLKHNVQLTRVMLHMLADATPARIGRCGWRGGGGGWARLCLDIVLRRLRVTTGFAAAVRSKLPLAKVDDVANVDLLQARFRVTPF